MFSVESSGGSRWPTGRRAAATTMGCGIVVAVVLRVIIFFWSADLGKPSLFRELLPVALTFALLAAVVGAVWLAASFALEFGGRAKPEPVGRDQRSATTSRAPGLGQTRYGGRVALQTAILLFSGVALSIGSCFGFVSNHDILSPNEPLTAAARTFEYLMVLGLLAAVWAIVSLFIEILLWILQKRR